LFVFVLNANLSIDFTGGMNIRVATNLDESFSFNVSQYLAEQGIDNISVQTKAEELFTDIIIKTQGKTDDEVSAISA
jgi:preprotein translocase subunit SecF